MTTPAKHELLDALNETLLSRPSYAVVCRLTESMAEAMAVVTDAPARTRLAEPVLRFVWGLTDDEAAQVVETARQNPAAIHALHDQMQPHELLATAAVFLCLGVAILPDYTPSSPSVVDRATD